MLDMNVLLADKIRCVTNSNNGFSTFHPIYLAFEYALRSMRKRITDGIDSTARFPLPFAVEAHIHDICPLYQPKSGCKILRVTLLACAETYTVVNKETTFIEI